MSYLVIQGLEVETPDLKEIAKLCGASRIENRGHNAFWLHDYKRQDGVAEYCARAQLDFAFVPAPARLSDFRLLVMDMDSTLITIETIDELADLVGRKTEVAAVTAQAMRGEIEYDESLRRRVAVLKGLPESALERLYTERVRLSPGAERMIEGVRKAGLKTLLVSGGFTQVTDRLKKRLSLDYVRANTLGVENGRFTGELVGRIVNADVKRKALLDARDGIGATRDQIIAIGDGANDLAFMGEAGVSIAYHAKPVVRTRSRHCFDYVGLDGLLNLQAS
ncbi:MAG TPA: phosphoserine phosphatase SerB [Burkholderiales bacterium]|nr:phosphoserine phosphatase SerB [Burkholderiales bacterium]